ncbi:Hpt domain-containing protein [Caenimonas koreensis]|uniref:HPt domain-containing protein n=1 Tax=Caenimonas koreensis DSM 17982 TaxID=1121255 RepID=A0A844AUI7_9BURK|nr:Hpt domain-containing protein [Caenimonas koreensis]MRD46038.1 hypothetical protein [Caenimonas koreensis DSM 17982]
MNESMSVAGTAAMLQLLGMLPPASRREMVRMYRAMLIARPDEIADALARNDDPCAIALAHQVAGSAGMMQDSLLSAQVRSMEHALCEGRRADALVQWALVLGSVAATRAALDEAFPDSP